MFTLDPIDELVDTLKNAGIRADVDPAKVHAPGVWVQPTGLDLDTLASTRVAARLVLVVPDKNPGRAYDALVDLLNKVAAVIPVRTAVNRTVLMPDGALLPGLEIPWSGRTALTA